MNNHQADIKYWLDIDSKVVKTLRFLLAIMVVCIHSYIPNQSNYFIIMMSHTLSHIAVPLFFLIFRILLLYWFKPVELESMGSENA